LPGHLGIDSHDDSFADLDLLAPAPKASRSLDVDVNLLLVRLRLVVLQAFGAGRKVEVVDAERGHAQRPPKLFHHAVELV
jgi:hypothetical protein